MRGLIIKNIDDFRNFLRSEAESIRVEIDKMEKRITDILVKQGVEALDKIVKLENKKQKLEAQEFKLYELIGKMN